MQDNMTLFTSTVRRSPGGQFVAAERHPLREFGSMPRGHDSHLLWPMFGATKLKPQGLQSESPAFSATLPRGQGTHNSPLDDVVPGSHNQHSLDIGSIGSAPGLHWH